MQTFFYRLSGALLLDASMYEGIEADRRATGQALVVVLLSSLAAGIGAGGWRGPDLTTTALFAGIALLTWVAWAMLMFQIGARWMPEPQTEADVGQLLRTIGFATAPGLLQAFAIFPRVTVAAFAIAWIWMFAATVVAVRQALDYRSTWRTIGVCGVAAALSLAVAIVLGLLFTPTVSS